MKVDIGALLSVINEDTLLSIGKDRTSLQKTKVHLQTYTKEEIPILCSCSVTVQTSKNTALPDSGPNLFGRDWLAQLKLERKKFF